MTTETLIPRNMNKMSDHLRKDNKPSGSRQTENTYKLYIKYFIFALDRSAFAYTVERERATSK